MQQMSLFSSGDMSKLEKQFWKFHDTHPEVYECLRSFGLQWRARNPMRICGISMLYERARWEVSMDYSDRTLKLSNNHKPFYARLLTEKEASLNGMFKLKKQKKQATFGPLNKGLEDDIQLI